MKLRLRGCTVGAGVANGIAPEGRCGGPPAAYMRYKAKRRHPILKQKAGRLLQPSRGRKTTPLSKTTVQAPHEVSPHVQTEEPCCSTEKASWKRLRP